MKMNEEKVSTAEQTKEQRAEQAIILINEETLQERIYVIRGQKVMLDADLAELYGYETKAFNRQVKNNIEKFEGEDFTFQLTWDELEKVLRCKNCTLNRGEAQGQHVKYLPHAFTEQGIYMLMTVLRGELAIKQSRALIRTFKKMKDYIIENQNLIGDREYLQLSMQVSKNYQQTMDLRMDLNEVEDQMAKVVDKLSDMVYRSELKTIMTEFGEPHIKRGYLVLNGEPFQADLAYNEIYRSAKESIIIIDNYISLKTFELLMGVNPKVKVKLFSDNLGKGLSQNLFDDFCMEHPGLHMKLIESGGIFHDRYIILDYNTSSEKIFHCGASSKDAGLRVTSIMEDTDREKYHPIVDKLLENPPLVLK